MGREFAVSGCAPMTSEHPGVSIVIMKVDHGESTRRPNLLIGTHLVPVTLKISLVTARPIDRPLWGQVINIQSQYASKQLYLMLI